MKIYFALFAILIILLTMMLTVPPMSAQESSSKIPDWIRNNTGWWAEGSISDDEFLRGLEFLLNNGFISIDQSSLINSEKEIQKKADEYWDCSQGIHHDASSTCILYDEKYIIGGINELKYISKYDIICDVNCELTLHKHYDVDKKLEKFQNENLHKQLFDIYVSITPKTILDEVIYFRILTDDYGSGPSASINPDEDYPFKFALRIDPVDMAPSGSTIDYPLYKAAVIHENGHILSFSSSQSDNDMPLYANDKELREIVIKKQSLCAPNFYTDVSGCMKDGAYLNLFFQKFWIDLYPDFKWSYEFDDYFDFLDHNAEFYEMYQNQFLTEYTAFNPEEDFAESFMVFVLFEKPTESFTIPDQKILFFYDFSEIVEMRDFIRKNL